MKFMLPLILFAAASVARADHYETRCVNGVCRLVLVRDQPAPGYHRHLTANGVVEHHDSNHGNLAAHTFGGQVVWQKYYGPMAVAADLPKPAPVVPPKAKVEVQAQKLPATACPSVAYVPVSESFHLRAKIKTAVNAQPLRSFVSRLLSLRPGAGLLLRVRLR